MSQAPLAIIPTFLRNHAFLASLGGFPSHLTQPVKTPLWWHQPMSNRWWKVGVFRPSTNPVHKWILELEWTTKQLTKWKYHPNSHLLPIKHIHINYYVYTVYINSTNKCKYIYVYIYIYISIIDFAFSSAAWPVVPQPQVTIVPSVFNAAKADWVPFTWHTCFFWRDFWANRSPRKH